MPARRKIRLFILPAAFAALALLPGCGNYESHIPDSSGTYNYVPVVQENPDNGKMLTAPAPTQADPLATQGDPMVQLADPMASHFDPMTQSSGYGGTHPKQWSTKGWYWLNGSISGGSVAISVNGTPIGRFAAHIDKEVTAYCHPGINTVTFTHYPLNGGICICHINVLNGNAPKGTPPAATYDTSAEAAVAASKLANAPTSASANADPNAALSTTAPSAPTLSTMPDQSAATPDAANGAPVTETMSFFAQ